YRLLDFNCLNQIEGLHNPTAENLAVWMWDRLTLNGAAPRVVIVAETCESSCVFSGR
ncbi:MAG: 6-carboxytetrahydropterin synthase, partial [Candidatus Omnitrophica bacterium]|nr:6-carboxytetrahydropterin synthase [Candidatus Omnitrophota bacterium]